MVSRIRLAWWREALERLDRAPPPAEPLLVASAAELLPRSISGAALSEMEEGWSVLLDAGPLTDEALLLHAEARGARLFDFSAQLLGARPDEEIAAAGRVWALVDLARRLSRSEEAEAALAAARREAGPPRWPRPLRPLGMLAALARRDLKRGPPWEPPGSPPRVAAMLRHRLFGL